MPNCTLPKEERLSGKTGITALVSEGKWCSVQNIKYCWKRTPDGELNRIVVSVPKRLFKRAVKRNLLKRRIRESYRLQKDLLTVKGIDILFQYNTKDVLESTVIFSQVESILRKVNSSAQPQEPVSQ
ncbi:MAG: ribonuclease P protein component [Bacteroidales bacterium]|nr:ribonuclease P protein component [Bacteroidales bacterium]